MQTKYIPRINIEIIILITFSWTFTTIMKPVSIIRLLNNKGKGTVTLKQAYVALRGPGG
jgi:hypothetical protein